MILSPVKVSIKGHELKMIYPSHTVYIDISEIKDMEIKKILNVKYLKVRFENRKTSFDIDFLSPHIIDKLYEKWQELRDKNS